MAKLIDRTGHCGRIKDLTGKRFGMLTVVEMTGERVRGAVQWVCRCDCGSEAVSVGKNLQCGDKMSCGCGGITAFQDLTGKRFGMLSVIERFARQPGSKGHVQWLCKCECGNYRIAHGGGLRCGRTKNCGCSPTISWKGKGSRPTLRSLLPPDEAAFNIAFRIHESSAKSRKREQALTRDQFRDLAPRDCFYCGSPPSRVQQSTVVNDHNRGSFVYNGIDRVDSNKAYTLDNCVPCCSACNRNKNVMSADDYLAYMERLARFQFPGAFNREAPDR